MVNYYKFFQNILLILFITVAYTAFAQSNTISITTVATDDGRTIITQERIASDDLESTIDKHFKSLQAGSAAKMNVIRKYVKEGALYDEAPLYLKRSKVVTGILLHYSAAENVASIRSIVEGSPADKAGLKQGDVILQVAGQPVNNLMDFIGVMCPLEGGNAIVVDFERDGVKMQETILLHEMNIDYLNPVHMEQEYASMETGLIKDLILEELRNEENIHQISISWGNDPRKDRMILFQVDRDQKASKKMQIIALANITVAPNPTNGKLYINFTTDETAETEIMVLNALGKEIFSEKFSDGTSYNRMIDLSGYPKGIYFVQLAQQQQRINKKIILQ